MDSSLKNASLRVGATALATHLLLNWLWPLPISTVLLSLVLVPSASSYFLVPHFSYPVALLLSFGIFYAILLASVATYRLSPIHPLARYPGPLSLKLSTFSLYQKSKTGKRHEYIRGLHAFYNSDVVRIGPDELSIQDPDAIGPVMGSNGLPKGPVYDGRSGYVANRGLIGWRDPAVHAMRRKSWTRGLNVSALKEYEPALRQRVSQLVDLLLSRKNKTIDLAEHIKYFAFDFMGDMAFGGGPEYLKNGDMDGSIRQMDAVIRAGILPESVPWVGYMTKGKFLKARQAAQQKAQARIVRGTKTKDLFHYLNHEDGAKGDPPSLDTVGAEGFLVIVAGSDTTVGVLSNALYLLMRNPATYKRLQSEVDKFYPPGEDALDTRYHSDMHFLDAVINETLRLYPAQLSGSQRATNEQGISAGSYYIPPYTAVRVHTFSIHRDPRNFYPLPEGFWPERWLIAEDPSSFKQPFVHNMNAFIPFSFGPSNCVGKNLALKEMKMVLCLLLQRVELAFAPGYDPEEWDKHVDDFFTLEIGRLPVVVKSRDLS